jgi:hypothetical protein
MRCESDGFSFVALFCSGSSRDATSSDAPLTFAPPEGSTKTEWCSVALGDGDTKVPSTPHATTSVFYMARATRYGRTLLKHASYPSDMCE